MKLRIQKHALRQIDRILSDISTVSPQGASRVEARISEIFILIRQHSQAGKRTTIARVRRVFLTPYPYLIDYFVGDDEIVVQRFRHAARNPVTIPGVS
ncbi:MULTISPECIES: type II toxin-antitoxin system RelE/ParE family toxin [Methylobacterium]|uniref:type II toxin-antitoxin system RelE/ParE family toxin n=1 Tax=Methylobacterium TaxID=407 RepID=UPI0011CA035E|nr:MULTISPECIES: type II toxin-antitoxin system RelE/ParE family toxin [Methylobacterium]TXN19293.1 type II toxin-antitoxin system RelE/ParE family toxin [Methylobacterium sp. WL9]